MKGYKRLFLAVGLILALILSAGLAWGGDGALDPTFNNLGAGVQKIPIIRGQADWTSGGVATGNSLVWGYFTSVTDSVQTYSRSSIAKLTDNTGTVDPNFSFSVNGELRGAMLTDPSNPTCDILIWGAFSLPSSGPTFYNLARLTNSGSGYTVDAGFPVIFNPGGLVTTVSVIGTYLSNNVLVGGYNLQPVLGAANTAYHLIRLTSSFAYDTTYNNTNNHARSLPGGYVNGISFTTPAFSPIIFGTLPQGDGSYHWWEKISNTDGYAVVKSLGTSAASGPINYGPIDGPIFNMAQPSGTSGPWIIIGAFKNVFNTNLNRVAQLNNTLTGLDDNNSFNTNINLGGGADHAVQKLFIAGTGQPHLAGGFTKFNGISYGHIVRLQYAPGTGGNVDTSFNYNIGPPLTPTAGADDRIFNLYKLPGISPTLLQITGSFQHYNGTARGGIATIDHATGAIQSSYYANVNPTSTTPGTVYALETTWSNNGPRLLIGGDFTGVGGKFRQGLARLNQNGSVDDSFTGLIEGQVNAIRTLEGGQILIAGNFGAAQGYGCTSLARLNQNGAFDTSFKPIIAKGDGTTAGLRLVDREDNGNVDIGGNFATVYDSSHTPQSRNAFAVLNSSGYDTSFNAQFNIPGADQIKVNTGGNLGSGYGMAGYARVSGNDRGFACALDSSGVQQTYLLFDGEVLCATGLADGRIVFGGNFMNVLFPAPAIRNHIAAITSSFTLDSNFAGAAADGPIWGMRTQGNHDNGKPLIAGAFTTYNGFSRAGVARLNLNGSLDNSFNPGTGTAGTGTVYGVTWFNNRAAFGGAFTSYNGTTMRGVAQVFASMGANTAAINLLLLGN